MMSAAQGSLGENLKLDWMRAPQTTVVVPVTAIAANNARSNKGTRFHIDGPPSLSEKRNCDGKVLFTQQDPLSRKGSR